MTRLAEDIREASKPIYCSACFNSQPIRHVDFDAACDRGYANEEAVKINMDDLILCENCVKEGLKVLGIEDSAELKAENEDLRRKLETKEKLHTQQQRYIDTLEDVVSQRGAKIDHRKKPRQIREEVSA